MGEVTERAAAEDQVVDTTQVKGGSLWMLWSLIALLLSYPLSVGPVALAFEGKQVPTALDVVYSPLNCLYKASPAAQSFFDWYLKLWGFR